MLKAHIAPSSDSGSRSGKPFWIDLFDPTPDEIARVAAEPGIKVPSRAALQEVETSSRLRAEGGVLYVSMPLSVEDEAAGFAPVPLGFILSRDVLITVRYSELHSVAHVEDCVAKGSYGNSASVFGALIADMVDFGADKLEQLSRDLATVSARAFELQGRSGPSTRRASRALRESLNAVGTAGAALSRIRETLLGLQRIVGFVLKMGADWLPQEQNTLLVTAQQDLASLVDYESHLSAKTQFLLDAILGFINTEQNDIFKVLTIVSVVGIPPTLIASMYGMNFRNMPELGWRWGYEYALALIAMSILVPIVWFKRRGWW
jgi:magnesium transporter